MKRSESVKEIATALNKFHMNLEQPKKSANNPFFKSKYVPLENVQEVVDKYGSPEGLTYLQETISNDKGQAGIRTIVMHTSGEFIESEPLYLPSDKNTAQGAGSALTYARRYSLSAAFGISSDDDDDGNGASGNDSNKKQQTKSQPKAPIKASADEIADYKNKLIEYATITGNADNKGIEKVQNWGLGQAKADKFEDITKNNLIHATKVVQAAMSKVQAKNKESLFDDK